MESRSANNSVEGGPHFPVQHLQEQSVDMPRSSLKETVQQQMHGTIEGEFRTNDPLNIERLTGVNDFHRHEAEDDEISEEENEEDSDEEEEEEDDLELRKA